MGEHETKPLIPHVTSTDGVTECKTYTLRNFLLIPVIVIYFVAMTTNVYVYSEWIQDKVQKEMAINSTYNASCKNPDHNDPAYVAYARGQQKTADWQMYVSLATAIPASFTVTLLPSYSDTFGRRFLFLAALSSQLVRLVISCITIKLNLSIVYIVVAAAIDGVGGSYFTFMSAQMAYIADLTNTGKQRTLGITVADGLLLVSITVGGLAAGYIIHYTGYFIPMLSCLIAISVDILLVVFFLPESFAKSKRVKATSVFTNIKRTLGFYSSHAFKDKRWGYSILIVAYFFTEFVVSHRSSVEMLYQLGMPFCWSSEKIGIFSAARHAAQGVIGVPFAWLLRQHTSNIVIAIISAIFNVASYVLEAFSVTDVMMYLVPVPATLSFLTVPMIKSIMSDMTPVDQQGALFASITAVQSLCLVTSSSSLNSIYAATVSVYRGFVFLVCAGVGLITVTLLIIYAIKLKRQTAIAQQKTDIIVN